MCILRCNDKIIILFIFIFKSNEVIIYYFGYRSFIYYSVCASYISLMLH